MSLKDFKLSMDGDRFVAEYESKQTDAQWKKENQRKLVGMRIELKKNE